MVLYNNTFGISVSNVQIIGYRCINTYKLKADYYAILMLCGTSVSTLCRILMKKWCNGKLWFSFGPYCSNVSIQADPGYISSYLTVVCLWWFSCFFRAGNRQCLLPLRFCSLLPLLERLLVVLSKFSVVVKNLRTQQRAEKLKMKIR